MEKRGTASLSNSWIEKNTDVCGGDACIRDTRIAVCVLVEEWQAGLSDDQVLAAHPELGSGDLEAAREYYVAHRAEIDQAITDNSRP